MGCAHSQHTVSAWLHWVRKVARTVLCERVERAFLVM